MPHLAARFCASSQLFGDDFAGVAIDTSLVQFFGRCATSLVTETWHGRRTHVPRYPPHGLAARVNNTLRSTKVGNDVCIPSQLSVACVFTATPAGTRPEAFLLFSRCTLCFGRDSFGNRVQQDPRGETSFAPRPWRLLGGVLRAEGEGAGGACGGDAGVLSFLSSVGRVSDRNRVDSVKRGGIVLVYS